jgi:hypothetical protein
MQQQNEFHDRDDLVCSNCRSEVMIKHTGDTSKGYGQQAYTCSCGTKMQFEHQHSGQEQTTTVGSR